MSGLDQEEDLQEVMVEDLEVVTEVETGVVIIDTLNEKGSYTCKIASFFVSNKPK